MAMLKQKLVISILVILSIVALGCVSYSSETPSDTVNSFVKAGSYEDFDACYKLMSDKYRNNHTFEEFKDTVYSINSGFDKYEFIDIVNGSEIISNNTAFVEIEVKKYVDKGPFEYVVNKFFLN